MRLLSTVLIASLSASAVWACASGTPEAQTPADETPATEASTAPAASAAPLELPATWQKDMSKEMQIAFMKEKVIPAMDPVFKAYDAKEFANFGCETCHGPEYKTPTQYLPALTLKDGKLTAFETDPEVSKWMAEKVVPAMAAAMGMAPYNPETHEGFGCGGCHAIEPG
jgi:hypothetical protein